MKNIGFSDIRITGGLWKTKQDMIKNTTIYSVYNRFKETNRFDALRCQWKKEGNYEGHIFWDSDVAKWLESAAYLLIFEKNEKIEKIVDETVEEIIRNSDENGYFNSYYLTTRQEERFRNRSDHELYCAGHLMEAAVAYYQATGKDAFLKAMRRYADYIEKVFKIENSAGFITPGHPELELALVRLYEATGEKRYLELSKYFIDMHGTGNESLYGFCNEYYNQDEMPIRDRSTAEGHAVRALYLMSGAADIAEKYSDSELKDACRRVYENIVNKRMYITGGVGSTYLGEAFTVDYDLPNRTAYSETCAAIALALYAGRLQKLEADSSYADTFERAIYNGVLAGISMDGRSFFYENPLEIDPKFNHVNTSTTEKERFPITQRLEVFDCSCCPPNMTRFLLEIAEYMYTYDEEVLYVNHYMESEADTDGIHVIQKTEYPADGTVTLICETEKKYLALRIPGWCTGFRVNHEYFMKNGYAYILLNGKTEVCLKLDMPVVPMAANREVHADAGRVAVMRGPVVYCIEGVDNGEDLKSVALDISSDFRLGKTEFLLPNLETTAYRPKACGALYHPAGDDYEAVPLKMIPYYAYANRGETEMQVWILRRS